MNRSSSGSANSSHCFSDIAFPFDPDIFFPFI